jgi:hypothetical protein
VEEECPVVGAVVPDERAVVVDEEEAWATVVAVVVAVVVAEAVEVLVTDDVADAVVGVLMGTWNFQTHP